MRQLKTIVEIILFIALLPLLVLFGVLFIGYAMLTGKLSYMKMFIVIALLAVLASCSQPNQVYVVTVEYANGDKVCKSFIGAEVWLDEGELKARKAGFLDASHFTVASSVRDFEITSTGELTSK